MSFSDGGRMTQAGRSFGAESIHPLKWLAEDFLVKIENGVERLILAVGGQIAVAGQIGEEEFEFLLAREGGGHGIERGHILAEPMDVAGFSCERHVLAAKDIAESFDGEMEIHNEGSLTGRVGQRLSKEKSWINEPPVRSSSLVCIDYEQVAIFEFTK